MQDVFTAVVALPWPFWLGYMAVLLVPGPNAILVSATAATSGLGGVLALMTGLSLGAAMLMTTVGLVAAGSRGIEALASVLPQVSAVLLFFAAWRLLRLQCARRDPDASRQAGIADGATGFACAASNPVTAAYFLAQFLHAPERLGAADLAIKAVGVFLAAMTIMLLYAVTFCVPMARRRVQANFTAIKVAAALFFCLLAVRNLLPLA